MGLPANVSSIGGLLRDFWDLSKEIPAYLYKESGTTWKRLRKESNPGWAGDGTIKFPSRSDMPAAGSQDLATAWANTSPSGQITWQVTKSEFWQVMNIDWFVKELSSDAQYAYLEAQYAEQLAHIRRWMHLQSFYCHQNGGGAIARLRSGFSVINQNTLELQNPKCAKFFEIGDKIQFSTDDGAQASPAGTKPGAIYEVTNVNNSAGTITVVNVSGGGPIAAPVADDDWIFLLDTYGTALRGNLAWTPLVTPAPGDIFFNVDVGAQPTRRAGIRYDYGSQSDPYSILTTALQRGLEEGISLDRVIVPPTVVAELIKQTSTAAIPIRSAQRSSNREYQQMGVSGWEIIYPGFDDPIMIYSDRFWEHPDLDASQNGGLWLFDKEDDFKLWTTASGISWKDYDGTGALSQVLGTQVLAAVFGAFMQTVLRDTSNRIIAGPTGVVVE